MSKFWPFTFNLLLFGGIAFFGPFIVLYYQGLGFSGTEIGLLTGITPLVILLGTPLWTGLADTTHRHRLMMSLAMLGASVAIFAISFMSGFVPIFLNAILFFAFFAPVTAFADSATMFMLGQQKDMYGRIRLGGTIGFGVTAAIAGALVQNYGLKVVFSGCAVLFFLAFIVSQKFVHRRLKEGDSTKGQMRAMLTDRRWIPFLTVAFAGGLAGAVTNTYLLPFMKELGASESTMGLALTIGTFAEIPVLLMVNRMIKRFRSYSLLMLAMVVTGVRLLLFALTKDPNLILVLQIFNGLTFVTMWVAGVSYADEHAPPGMGSTAQGLFGAMIFGFGGAIGGFVGGPLLESAGGRGLYLVFGILVLVIISVAAVMQTRISADQTRPLP